MVLDAEKQERVRSVFKLISNYNEDARNSTAAAREAMRDLVAELTTNKAERKWLSKSFRKAYAEYEANLKNEPDTLDDAIDIIAVVMPQGGA